MSDVLDNQPVENEITQPSGDEKRIRKKGKKIIAQLWQRARINAFAHKIALEEAEKNESRNYKFVIIFSLLSILFIILSSYANQISKSFILSFCIFNHIKTLDYNLLSILCAFISLAYTIISNHKRFGIVAEEHRFLQNSYQHIAQRAREAYFPTKNIGDLEALIDDLERDFSLLKARGREPSDSDFEKGLELFKKIKKDKTSASSQSFPEKVIVDEEKDCNADETSNTTSL